MIFLHKISFEIAGFLGFNLLLVPSKLRQFILGLTFDGLIFGGQIGAESALVLSFIVTPTMISLRKLDFSFSC